MPNLAWCHHFIRASRVAACLVSVGELGVAEPGAGAAFPLCGVNPSLFVAASASAPAAPNCFKNDRLVLSFQSIDIFLSSPDTARNKQSKYARKI
jgi:hypothetical protein